MKIIQHLLMITALLLGISTVAYADNSDISGSYECKGYDPYVKTYYNGTIDIKKTGNTYHFIWHLGGNDIYNGTGLINKNLPNVVSAIFYSSDDVKSAGVETFNIQPDGTLEGQWTMNGKDLVGRETCKKVS